jgi:hypothetical protein
LLHRALEWVNEPRFARENFLKTNVKANQRQRGSDFNELHS